MRALAPLLLLLPALAAAAPLAAQSCNGLPFRPGGGVLAATRLSGDAADAPYALEEYGGLVAHRLPGWTPLGTPHAGELHVALGSAKQVAETALGQVTLASGNGGSAGGHYTMDVLPSSVVGAFVVCLSAGVEGEWWRVSGTRGQGVTVPAWLSFGVPLRWRWAGFTPHAAFGGYWRSISGDVPGGSLREHGFRPWSNAGVGLLLGPLRLDGQVGHEFKTRQRLVLSAGVEL